MMIARQAGKIDLQNTELAYKGSEDSVSGALS
jgi:hypothetical protein